MRRIAFAVLTLAALPLAGQAGPGLFGDRHWRKPVETVGDLPVSASWGTVQLVSGELYWYDGAAWQPVSGGTGDPAVPPTVAVGSTTTGAPGSAANVVNSGTSRDLVLDFLIPRGNAGATGAIGATGATGPQGATGATGPAGAAGEIGPTGPAGADGAQGPTGPQGAPGATGAASTIAAGVTTTGTAGTSASVENSGTSSAAVFDFTIPRGDTGAAGAAGATGPQGPQGSTGATGAAGADGLPRTIQEEGVDLTQRDKINFIGAPVTCVDNAGASRTDCTVAAGSGTIGGTVGATADAVPVAIGTGGSTLAASTVKISAGVVVIPDGSASAPGLRFAGNGTGTGFYGAGSNSIGFAAAGATRFSISNSSFTNQNGGGFYNVGTGEAIFSPNPAGASTGLGSTGSNVATMLAAGFPIQEWTRPTGGVYRSTVLGQAVDFPQSVTCTDNGAGTAAALTINPTGAAIYVTNSDANGCVVTMGETNVTTGQRVELVVVSSAGGTVDFADTAGVTELAGAFTAGLYDSLALRYIADRWIETGRSDN